MKAPHLNQELLKTLLDYDPLTGIFVWRVRADVGQRWNNRYAGKRAGYQWTATGGGQYRSIRIFDWPFPEHRLAWLYVSGAWPEPTADHIDLDGLNNKWGNLREASKRQNAANMRLRKRNKTGFKGVSPDVKGRFRANISINGRQTWLGSFVTAEEAHAAYVAAAQLHFGEFARG